MIEGYMKLKTKGPLLASDPIDSAFILLANLIREELLTEEELKQFSLEAQKRIDAINRLRGA